MHGIIDDHWRRRSVGTAQCIDTPLIWRHAIPAYLAVSPIGGKRSLKPIHELLATARCREGRCPEASDPTFPAGARTDGASAHRVSNDGGAGRGYQLIG